MNLKENLIYLRSKNKLSLGDLQKILDTKSRSTYRHYEVGNSEPSAKHLVVLSETFRVTIDELIKKDLTI